MKKIVLNGESLTLTQVAFIAYGYHDDLGHHYPQIVLSGDAVDRLREFRSALESRIKAGDIIYGVNTGCGSKKGTIIPEEEINAYQACYIPAHCVSVGNDFPVQIVRLAMILRVNSFAHGNSGVTLELCEKILELYNKNVIPVVPEQGSVGSSGDLCHLANMSAALLGLPDQMVQYKGRVMASNLALKEAEIEPIELKAKEAMGLTNGSTFILAMGLLSIYHTRQLFEYANMAAALSLEAIRGEKAAFDLRVHRARRHESAVKVAEKILDLVGDSKRMTTESRKVTLPAERDFKKDVPRVQDAYSFRAHAQVAGSVLDALEFAEKVFLREMNASTDNPLVFRTAGDDQKFEAISGGNFHGEPLAQAADLLKIALQQLANISERRFYAMLKPMTSYGLPADLAGESGLNTGFMILQYSAASLVSENKPLCHPSVIDSIPTSADQEDYVSMGTISARNLVKVLDNAFYVIAAELMAGARGVSLTKNQLKDYPLAAKTQDIFERVNAIVPFHDGDQFWSKYWEDLKSTLKEHKF